MGLIVGGFLAFASVVIIAVVIVVFAAYWFKRFAKRSGVEKGGEGPVYEEVDAKNLK